MRDLRNAILLFHAGLAVFSVPPALLLLLLQGPVAGLAAVAAFQLPGVLFRTGHAGGFPLRLSFWTLKMLQSLRLIPEYAPERMVVAMNNRKALASSRGGFTPDRTLILLPHCLQSHECPVRLTYDPDGCKRCGRCPMGSLLDLRDRFGTGFAIVSGGTSARRKVEELKPSLIIAVACPVDLSLGIMDVHPITTVGVLNQWRSGPCFDTWVDAGEVEAALSLFLGGT